MISDSLGRHGKFSVRWTLCSTSSDLNELVLDVLQCSSFVYMARGH